MKKASAFKTTEKHVMKALGEVMDPEIHISVVDLGLVYKVTVAKKKLYILMTLTTIGCPLFSLIETEVRNKMKTLGFRDSDIRLELTFNPPWSMERLSKRGRAILGI